MTPKPYRTSHLAREMASEMDVRGGVPIDLEKTFIEPDKRPRFKTFIPLDDQVAFHTIAPPKKTESGLDLPDNVRDSIYPTIGIAIACGPNCKFIKEGDRVVIPGQLHALLVSHGGSGIVALAKESQLLAGVELPPEEIEKNRKAAEKNRKAAESPKD